MSDDQFSLPGFDAPPPTPSRKPSTPKKKAAFSLFLAVQPADDEKPRFDGLVEGLRRQHGLKPAITHDRRHLSLLSIEEYDAMPSPAQLDARCGVVAAALSGSNLPSLSINFTSAMTFGRPGGTREMPYVLRCDDESAARVLDLCQRLGPLLIGKAPRSFVPHMTLLYDSTWVGQHAIDPLNWTARKLVLILSHVGKSRYDDRGQWELGA